MGLFSIFKFHTPPPLYLHNNPSAADYYLSPLPSDTSPSIHSGPSRRDARLRAREEVNARIWIARREEQRKKFEKQAERRNAAFTAELPGEAILGWRERGKGARTGAMIIQEYRAEATIRDPKDWMQAGPGELSGLVKVIGDFPHILPKRIEGGLIKSFVRGVFLGCLAVRMVEDRNGARRGGSEGEGIGGVYVMRGISGFGRDGPCC